MTKKQKAQNGKAVKTILIVDDEPHILLIVCSRLKANGYNVLTALSGEQGLKRALEEKPDLILLDYVMAGMDGEEVLRHLKRAASTRRIPVIMLTADVKNVEIKDYKLRGAVDCIFKPFPSEELLDKVKKALRRKH